MKKALFGALFISVCLCLLMLSGNVHAQEQQTLTVTVNNAFLDIPVTPIIVRSENVATHTLGLVVEVGNAHINSMLDFAVTIKNTATGEETTQNFHQTANGSARSTLDITSLIPGTEYEFRVRYSRDGANIFSANSNPHRVMTLIDPPILDSISNVNENSATVNVVVDPAFVGSTMDFVVEVRNEDTGDTYTVQMTKDVTSSSVGLDIDDLDPGTEYSFRVKYARENTSNYSGYSNQKSAVTDFGAPTITDIDNITDSSMDLHVDVDGSFAGEDADFVVEIKNNDTGEVQSVTITQGVNGSGSVVLAISGLEPGTNYSFRVRYARESSENFSDYSNAQNGSTTGEKDNGKVNVCHDGNTISIARSALQTHLGHGDTEGPCKNAGGGTTGVIDTIKDVIDGIVSGGSEVVGKEVMDPEKEALREAIAPETMKPVYETAATVGVMAGVIAALAGSAVPLFAATPGLFSSSLFLKLIELFGVIGRRKEERNWGTVFDKVTHMPIPAAKIVLIDEMGNEMSTTYSDKDGRFGFLATPGRYLLQVFKKDYEVITSVTEDELYGNVYNGEPIIIAEDNVILSNIAMKSLRYDWAKFAEKKIAQYHSKFSTFKKALFIALHIFGFGATVVITYFYPSAFNFVVLSIYVVLFVYQIFFKEKKYGMIETGGGKPIPFAVVSLHDTDSNEKKRFAVTDAIGRYYLLADNGKYNMKAKGQPVSGAAFEKQGDIHVDDGIVRKDIVV